MKVIGEFEYDNLLAGDTKIVAEEVVIKKGETIPKFSVIAIDGTGQIVTPKKDDESLKVYGILIEDVDASKEEKVSVAYLTGEFNSNVVIFPEGTTIDDFKVTLREIGIFLKENIKSY